MIFAFRIEKVRFRIHHAGPVQDGGTPRARRSFTCTGRDDISASATKQPHYGPIQSARPTVKRSRCAGDRDDPRPP
ncbi:hypothetical protein EVAR_64060_1 [Eumeta japonica]|uniref:Uncharacterized protein n=1 Tax=Eumeta variegata TaxID=151549 RepID=A0A4C1ZTP6_EUMVA|nr:hypothetical protein EVAR_64060_1 [Eumeta japonica]